MPLALSKVAASVFEVLLAPLVVGGAVRPGHAIGARAALALGGQMDPPLDPQLVKRVAAARVRAARALVPIDILGPPTPAEWTLGAALHDVLVAANPTFDAPLRRRAAERILELAGRAIDRVPMPTTVGDALSRHTWFARMLDITRKDTSVSWWVGSQTFLGVEPPARLTSWPALRRVNVLHTPRSLLELAPLAVHRSHFTEVIAHFIARTPLTDMATCVRAAPQFTWSDGTLAFIATRTGRALTTRALARLPASEVDAVLGRATRVLLQRSTPPFDAPVLGLLADRAAALASGHLAPAAPHPAGADVAFAQAIGAVAALRELSSSDDHWSADDRRRLHLNLSQLARTAPLQGLDARFVEKV